MRLAMLSPVAWRTPPRHYGPWENCVSLLTEGLVERGVDVTLFATADSKTKGKLHAICPTGYEENKTLSPKVWECLHISEVFERAGEFDLIHNNFDFLPLTYSGLIDTPLITTIHGFSSPKIIPVYKKYNKKGFYVSISDADRSSELDYAATIYHGIDLSNFTFKPTPGEYLLFFGRMHWDKGPKEAIDIARKANMKLIMAGIIQDEAYYQKYVAPYIDEKTVSFVGSAGPELRDRLLGGAYALLHPINFAEPFGLSVIESMACGTPVIAFNRGSMPELIRDKENGFLVSNVDEAGDVLKEIPNIDRAFCRKWAEDHFTIDRMVEDYLEVYQKVLGIHQES
jgi:glycosyltransferase involved in cell wall biosynthesis